MASSWWSYISGDQKNPNALPPVTALQEQRAKQITSLRNLNPTVVELKVQTEYRITFQQQGQNIALHIILPAQFPQEKPVVHVTPPVRHPWVSPAMEVVGCARLLNYGVHTDLGRLVQDIVQEFNRNPPVIFSQVSNQQPSVTNYTPYPDASASQIPVVPQPPYNTYQPMQNLPGAPQPAFMPQWPPIGPMQGATDTSGSISHIEFPSSVETGDKDFSSSIEADSFFVKPNTPPPLLQGPSSAYQCPDIVEGLSMLTDLSIEELQLLLDDERKFMEVFQAMPGMKQFFDDRHELYQTCQGLAKHNLSHKPELDRRTESLKELEAEQNELGDTFHKNCLKQQGLNKQCDPQNLLDNIRVASADAEQTSDSLAEEFMDGTLPLEEFLRKYSDIRKSFHLRKVKEEKLTQMINDRSFRY